MCACDFAGWRSLILPQGMRGTQAKIRETCPMLLLLAAPSAMLGEKCEQPLRQPIEVTGKRAAGKTDVPAFPGLLEAHHR